MWACLKKLMYYLNNFSFRIVSKDNSEESRKQVQFFEELFEEMEFKENSVYGIVLSKFFGYGVSEVIYQPEGNIITAKAINWLPPEWFGFDYMCNLIYFLDENSNDFNLVKVFNEPDEKILAKGYNKHYDKYLQTVKDDPLFPYRIILVRQNSLYNNPYGESDGSRIFYEVVYRNMSKRYRALNVEKFGMPPLVLETVLKEEAIMEAKRILADSTSGIITMSPDSKLTALQIPNETRLMFTTQIEDADRIIQDIILMQSGAQDLAKVGSRAAIEVFEESAMKGVWACKKDIEYTANRLIKNVCQINGQSVNCYYELYDDRQIDYLEELDIDKTLMDVSGLRFRKQYFIDKYSRNVNDFVPESLSDEILKIVDIEESSVEEPMQNSKQESRAP